MIKDHLIYFGFSMRDGQSGFFEFFRFAMDSQGPAFRKTTGEKITSPQDLLDLGFKTIVLHETSFAYNARRLETMLHTHFWDERNSCGVRGGRAATTRVIDTSRCCCCYCCCCCQLVCRISTTTPKLARSSSPMLLLRCLSSSCSPTSCKFFFWALSNMIHGVTFCVLQNKNLIVHSETALLPLAAFTVSHGKSNVD